MTSRTAHAAFSVRPPEPAQPAIKVTTAVLGLAVAVFMHIAAAVWWAASMNARMHQLEAVFGPAGGDASITATLARLDERTKRMDSRENAMAVRVLRLEQRAFGGPQGEAP